MICTDKTGTLTEGKMTMVKMWSAGKLYDVSGAGFNPHVGKIYRSQDKTAIPHAISNKNPMGLRSSISGKSGNGGMTFENIVKASSVPGQDSEDSGQTEKTVRSTLLAALLCSNTTIAKDEETGLWQPRGNSSEAPLVVAAAKIGFWESEVSKNYPRVLEIPFNSSRKMMVTVCEVVSGGEDQERATIGQGGIAHPLSLVTH